MSPVTKDSAGEKEEKKMSSFTKKVAESGPTIREMQQCCNSMNYFVRGYFQSPLGKNNVLALQGY